MILAGRYNVHFLDNLLETVVKAGGSDLHIHVGCPFYFRNSEGVLEKIQDVDPSILDQSLFESIANRVLHSTNAYIKLLEKEEVDITYITPSGYRFRVNLGLSRRQGFGVFRFLKDCKGLSLEKLQIPSKFTEKVESLDYGLVIVGGATGSGKSTTLAAVSSYLMDNYSYKLITLEDPIEYIIEGRKGYVVQREVGIDTLGFASGLRAAMREDPDYIIVGEIRDRDTASNAVIAAETGHVVFATLHIKDVFVALDRMCGMFPYEEQNALRIRTIDMLEVVMVQQLIREKGNTRLLTQCLLVDDEVRSLLSLRDFKQLKQLVYTGRKGWNDFPSV